LSRVTMEMRMMRLRLQRVLTHDGGDRENVTEAKRGSLA